MAFLVLAAGCRPSTEVKLDANDNKRHIELEKGQTLFITLESNPTTGFMWEVVEFEGHILRQLGEPEFKPQSDAVGAPGVQTFRFEAVNAGHMVLKLVYHRSWEKDVAPLKTFSLQMEVH